jgi:MFS transporter, FHS family, Na+ dependent glucose transporter 1
LPIALTIAVAVGTVADGGYIFAFSVTSCDLQLSESRAAYLTATYWGTFTAGRVLAIPLSMVATPRTLTAMDIAGCLVASFAFYAFSDNEFVVWLSTGLFGLSLASVFPSTFTMLERYIPLSGRAASVIMVGSAAGEMIMPLIIGQAFEIVGPGTFPMIIALTSIIGCIVFVALLKVA